MLAEEGMRHVCGNCSYWRERHCCRDVPSWALRNVENPTAVTFCFADDTQAEDCPCFVPRRPIIDLPSGIAMYQGDEVEIEAVFNGVPRRMFGRLLLVRDGEVYVETSIGTVVGREIE